MTIKRKPAQVERDRRLIATLYLQGKIQPEIAYELKISQSTVSREIKLLVEDWKKERVYDINEAKAKELAKIDVLELEYWDAWSRSQNDAVKRIKGMSKTQGEYESTSTEGQVGDARFLQGVMDCIKQRCAILGVEAPKAVMHEGEIGVIKGYVGFSPAQWESQKSK